MMGKNPSLQRDFQQIFLQLLMGAIVGILTGGATVLIGYGNLQARIQNLEINLNKETHSREQIELRDAEWRREIVDRLNVMQVSLDNLNQRKQ